jgi:hypothetical protein
MSASASRLSVEAERLGGLCVDGRFEFGRRSTGRFVGFLPLRILSADHLKNLWPPSKDFCNNIGQKPTSIVVSC